jgi:prepilin-type N-terminal cleavage/methylation domain-containing protein
MIRNKAFTLIELIIVIALIMILATVSLGAYTLATTRSQDTQRKNDLTQIAKSLEAFVNDVGRYPLSDGAGQMLCYEKVGSVVTSPNPACTGNKLTSRIDNEVTSYITFPTEPIVGNVYYYESDSTGSSFSLYTVLQNPKDRDLIFNEDGSIFEYTPSCGNGNCNYKITEVGLIKTNE